MKALPKAPAGGIVRTSLDNAWGTPPRILDRARVYFGGQIPFDPATTLANTTRATRFCAGRLEVVEPLVDKDRNPVETPEETAARGAERRRSFLAGLARGQAVSAGMAGVNNALMSVDAPCSECGDFLFFSARARGWGLCGPCSRRRAVLARTFLNERMQGWPFRSGLETCWMWPTWVNPPYGRELKKWLVKIVKEARATPSSPTPILALLPCARWEQGYFQDMRRAANAECFIRGRVAFISSIDYVPVSGNPTASVVMGFNVNLDRFAEAFSPLGACFEVRTINERTIQHAL